MSSLWCDLDVKGNPYYPRFRMLSKAVILPNQMHHAEMCGQSIMNWGGVE